MESAIRGAEKGYAGYHEAPFLRDLRFDKEKGWKHARAALRSFIMKIPEQRNCKYMVHGR